MEKGENAGYQHFLISNCVFKRLLPRGGLKSGSFGKLLTHKVALEK